MARTVRAPRARLPPRANALTTWGVGLVIGFGDGPGRAAAVSCREAGLGCHTGAPERRRLRHRVHRRRCQILALASVGPDAVLAGGVLVNTGAISSTTATWRGRRRGPGGVLAGRVTMEAGVEIGAGAPCYPTGGGGRGPVGAGGAVITTCRPERR